MTLVVVLSHFVSSNNRQVDHQNTQFNVEEATEGLFSFDHSDEHQEVSIGGVEKETKANKKKASKRDIIVVYDKELLARNSERIPKDTKKVNFWCLNVKNEWAAERNALPQNSADLFSQVPSDEVLHTVVISNCGFGLANLCTRFVRKVVTCILQRLCIKCAWGSNGIYGIMVRQHSKFSKVLITRSSRMLLTLKWKGLLERVSERVRFGCFIREKYYFSGRIRKEKS